MSFKFTLFKIEYIKKGVGMMGRVKGRVKQQDKFRKAVKKCHRKTLTPKTFGKCMKKELRRKGLRSRTMG